MIKKCTGTYLFQILKSYGGDATVTFLLWEYAMDSFN